jgi:hypothetical protein
MFSKLQTILLCISLTLLLSACGGGGGGGNTPSTPPTKAIIKVSVSGVPTDGTLVGGIKAAFTLPTGTYLPIDASTGEISTGIVTLSGVANGSLSAPNYDQATRLVSFGIINATGFGNGEILTITASITAGATVRESDFPTNAAISPSPLQLIDVINLNPIVGAACPISVTLQ